MPGDDSGEALDTEAAGDVHISVGEHSLSLVGIGLGSEHQREELHRLQAASEVVELGGQLTRGLAGDRTALVGCSQEDQRPPELVGRVAPHEGITCELVCLLQMVGCIGEKRPCLDSPELEQKLWAQLRSRRLAERTTQQ